MSQPAADADVALGIECALPAAYPLGQGSRRRRRAMAWLHGLALRMRIVRKGRATVHAQRP